MSLIDQPRRWATLRVFVGSCILTLVALGGGAMADDAPESPSAKPEPARPPETRAEIQRELDLRIRDREKLLLRVGDAGPTEKQQEQLDSIDQKIADLERALEAVQQATAEKVEESEDTFKARWLRFREAFQDLTRYDLKDGMFRWSIGIRLQLDGTLAWEDSRIESDIGSLPNSVKFRRARLFARGRLLRAFDFHLEYDFGGDQGLKDAYLEGAKYTKHFLWRIGHFKEPFSLERQASGYDLAFPEWAAPVPTFSPGRSYGIMLRHSEASDRLFWAVSTTTAGKATDDNRSNAKFAFTTRITGLPRLRDEGRRLVHLGASYSVRNEKSTQFASRPEARFAPFFVDTGNFDADTGSVGALEFAIVHDALWVQAEWFVSTIETDSQGRSQLDGGYVETGWFLSGESRFYVPERAAFGRLTPTRRYRGGNPFRNSSPGGALEVVGRVSTVDLNSGPIDGGEMRNFSVGLNWYLSQTQKISANYVHSQLRGSGRANLFLVRYQFNP